jgi:hypothetical protein
MAERRFTPRGFRVFHDRRREPEERLYGDDAAVSVVESSLAGRGPHVRIYEGTNCVQLNVAEAIAVRDALDVFVAEATADLLTEAPSA